MQVCKQPFDQEIEVAFYEDIIEKRQLYVKVLIIYTPVFL